MIVGLNSNTSFGVFNISKLATVKNSSVSTNVAVDPSKPKRARSLSDGSKARKKPKSDGQDICPFCQNKKHTMTELRPSVANSTSERYFLSVTLCRCSLIHLILTLG